jgi:hypothetical protein
LLVILGIGRNSRTDCDAKDVFLDQVMKKIGFISLFCCRLLWIGVDILSSAGLFETQLGETASSEIFFIDFSISKT